MCDIACCGPCFAPAALDEEGFFYPWLHELLSSTSEKVIVILKQNIFFSPMMKTKMSFYLFQKTLTDSFISSIFCLIFFRYIN